MARPVNISWPSPSTTAICTLQTRGSAGLLTIDGSLATVVGQVNPYVAFSGFSRNVSITAPGASNNTTVNFTVTGTYNGAAQSETIAGPNSSSTVQTSVYFDTVTSISTSAATVGSGVSVGTGTIGQTWWQQYNYNCAYSSLSVAVDVTGTINYAFQYTFDDIQSANPTTTWVGIPAPDTTGPNAYRLAMSSTTTDDVFNTDRPFRFYGVRINSSTNGSLGISFLQQGLQS